jgi:hypothetical protein
LPTVNTAAPERVCCLLVLNSRSSERFLAIEAWGFEGLLGDLETNWMIRDPTVKWRSDRESAGVLDMLLLID